MDKQHAKSTLMGYSKKELVEHCICAEHNNKALKESFEIQYQNCMKMIDDMKLLNPLPEEIGCTKEDYGNTWVPKLYGVYYYPDFEQPESVWRSQWTDTWLDNRIKNTVGIYKTKQQALDKAIKLGWLEEELK